MIPDYFTELPTPSDAILKSVAHAWNTEDALVRCAVSSLESPSAVVCAKSLFPELELSFGEIPDPDPRVPFDDVGIIAWRYDGFDSSTKLPFPNEQFQKAVSIAATEDFSLDAESEKAKELASEFVSLAPCEMIGAMVFPAPCPNGQWPWDWLFRSQVTTALVMAHRAESDWTRSTFGHHLLDLVHGPVDWVTTASLLGLLDISRRMPDSGVPELFLRLASRPMSPIWYMNAYKPLWRMLAHCPQLDAQTVDLVAKTNAAIDADEADDGG